MSAFRDCLSSQSGEIGGLCCSINGKNRNIYIQTRILSINYLLSNCLSSAIELLLTLSPLASA